MRALLEELSTDACLLDAKGRLTAVDDGFASLLGADPRTLVGEYLSSLVADRSVAEALLAVTAEDGPATVARECEWTAAGAGACDVECMALADAGDHAALLVVRDDGPTAVGGRRIVDEALSALPVAAMTLRADGSIESWNRAAEGSLGWTEGDVLGDRPPFLLPRADHEWQLVRERVQRGERVTDAEMPVRTADGTVRTAAVWAAPLEGERMLAVIHGIASPADQTKQLRLLDRVLRHNVRNEVNVVLGHAERLAGAVDDPDLAESVRAIRERSRSIVDLSEKARAFTDVIDAEHELQTVDVATLTRDLVETERQRNPGVEFVLDAPRTARADAIGPVQTAVANLLENAVEHNDADEPRVEVTVETTRVDGHDCVELAVADNGPGIPEAEREVFIEGHENPLDHGSGLGLWLVYWVVRKSDGELRYEENDPRGSVLTLRLASATGFRR